MGLTKEERNKRYYKGSLCGVCAQPITIKNKSGFCRKHNPNKMSKETRLSLSIRRIGSNNPNWKGDSVSYSGIHAWIKRRKPKPYYCECCSKKIAKDLANISQEYKRDLDDWEWLCRSCHS
jgi:hypothetical protein